MESTKTTNNTEEEVTFNKKDFHQLFLELENEVPNTPEEELEDITDLVLSSIPKLKDCEFLAKKNFDLDESMTAFGVMDSKMDMRLRRKEFMHPK